jgi:hypothetical protein
MKTGLAIVIVAQIFAFTVYLYFGKSIVEALEGLDKLGGAF